MDDVVRIKDLVFKYHDTLIFNRLNLNIKRGKYTVLTGRNGSGKSTLVKILSGLEKFEGYINIDGIRLEKENLADIRMKLGIVFETNKQVFVGETVIDEIAFMLENLCYPKEDIEREIKRVSRLLNLKEILNKDPNSLNTNDKCLVSLACALSLNPKVIIIDEVLELLDDKEGVLKKLISLKDMTIINITSNLEDGLLADDLIIVDEGELYMHGDPKEILLAEDKLKKLGFKLPFIIDMSQKLQFYELIDKPYFDMEEMVDAIWN